MKLKLYRATAEIGQGITNTFDIEAKNKEEVKQAIRNKGFEIKNWVIERIE